MDGIINVYKEKGFTSHDVVAKLRGILRMKKIGHTGTLDPAAEGVLPVCLGKGTRLCDMLTDKTKTYRAVLLLGQETDTQDTTGVVQAEYPVHVTEEEVRKAIVSFLGDYMQIPPMYSALKVNGKKLYELARQGKEVERQPRQITIHELELLEFQDGDCRLRVRCSKGTYIRTLCEDIGRALGCGGCMAALRRSRAGVYTLDRAIPLQQLLDRFESGQDVSSLLLPVDSLFQDSPPVRLTPRQERACRDGAAFSLNLAPGTYRLYGASEFLALGRCDEGRMRTIKSFFEVN